MSNNRMNLSQQMIQAPVRSQPRVVLEATTPEEIRSRGTGLTILAGVAASPFGHCLIAETARGIGFLAFFDPGGRNDVIAGMKAAWPLAKVVWDDGHAAALTDRVFAVEASATWNVHVRGTPFQLDVWRALLRVSAGGLVSYGELAAAAGHPKAIRATGTAVGANPVAFLIPCHRVILANGEFGQYRWGTARKRAMIAWEDANR